MLAQGTGGCLLFNVSKQAVNPGPNFGPYGLPKAATLFLVRQYALDYGADGIRANAVNADRIRSGLLTDDFIKARSEARGVSEKDYMSGNLLRPRGHGRGRGAGVPAPGAGAEDHGRCDDRGWREYRCGVAIDRSAHLCSRVPGRSAPLRGAQSRDPVRQTEAWRARHGRPLKVRAHRSRVAGNRIASPRLTCRGSAPGSATKKGDAQRNRLALPNQAWPASSQWPNDGPPR